MNRLSWRAVPRGDLSLLLEKARLEDSRAVGSSTVYQLNLNGQDVLAISLPDGQAVIVELNANPHTLRRRTET